MDLKEVLKDNYIPYAKGVIVGRAIPNIDGFKPVVRRILYVMHLNKLYNQNKKSQSIVGDTMKIHPNGDSAIYEALIRLTTGNGALNAPYIKSKGNFGRFYSKDIAPAAPRYTEARLSDIAELLFDGINENAVDMIPNYDSTTTEPALLPVKFPNILVNNTDGIAVAMSSSIPCFGLVEVCRATIGILNGTIETDKELADCLIAPEFPTGGNVHIDRQSFMNIVSKGRGSATVTGNAELYNNKISITEVPYGVKIEDIVNEVNNDQETFKDVSEAKNLTDRNGMRVDIILKRGAKAEEVYQKLIRHTKFRSIIKFNTSVIMDGRCHNEIGIMELLNCWIEFRLNTIKRIYEFRLAKKIKLEETLSVWEKIKDGLKDAVDIIVNCTEDDASKQLKSKFSLTDEQVQSLMGMAIRSLTADKLASKLKELTKVREEIVDIKEITNNPEKRKEISINELNEIIKKFGSKKNTGIKDPIVLSKKESEEISDAKVKIIITKNNHIKRLMNPEGNPKVSEQDPIKREIICKNNEYLLAFSSTGYCYRIKINDIDCSRTVPSVYINSLIEPVDNGQIVYITSTDAEKRLFTVLHSNSRYDVVLIDRFLGNRRVYKNAFNGENDINKLLVIEDTEFFVITNQNRATLVQIPEYIGSRLITKNAGSLKLGEEIKGVRVRSKVQLEDVERYTKGYFVKIKDTI